MCFCGWRPDGVRSIRSKQSVLKLSRRTVYIYIYPVFFAYPYIRGWCCCDAVNLQRDDTSFKSHPVYLPHWLTFLFYLSCYASLHCYSDSLGGGVIVKESSCATDAVEGFVLWREKQQVARKGWYPCTKIHGVLSQKVIVVDILARPLHIQEAPHSILNLKTVLQTEIWRSYRRITQANVKVTGSKPQQFPSRVFKSTMHIRGGRYVNLKVWKESSSSARYTADSWHCEQWSRTIAIATRRELTYNKNSDRIRGEAIWKTLRKLTEPRRLKQGTLSARFSDRWREIKGECR
jgi:hypothetical protein